MNSTELFKVIGLDLASLGIVVMPEFTSTAQ
jgi:hypothetical protein